MDCALICKPPWEYWLFSMEKQNINVINKAKDPFKLNNYFIVPRNVHFEVILL